jgi:hypothetical protein
MSELGEGAKQGSASQSPRPRRPREGVSEDCWICSYYRDRLAADSGATDMERDRVLGQRQRHRDMMHPGRDYKS